MEHIHKMAYHPQIWLATGRYVLEDAFVLSYTQSTTPTALEATIPLPDPSSMLEILDANPNTHFKIGNGILRASSAKFQDQRVWAAQYHRLNMRVIPYRAHTEVPVGPTIWLDSPTLHSTDVANFSRHYKEMSSSYNNGIFPFRYISDIIGKNAELVSVWTSASPMFQASNVLGDVTPPPGYWQLFDTEVAKVVERLEEEF